MLNREFNKRHQVPLLLFFTWGIFFIVLFARMLRWDKAGIWAGHVNVWSDWALHIGLANIFAEKNPSQWFSYHPMFADGKMTYTFLTNFISGMLMRMGLSLTLSFILPSILFSLTLLMGMYQLFIRLLGTPMRAYLAISLFFLSAGLGSLDFFHDLWMNPSWETLLSPPREYSRIDSMGWYGSNVIVSNYISQRAMVLGLVLATWAMALIMKVIQNPGDTGKNRKRLLFSAFLSGLLPIAHMHSLIAMVFLMAPVFILHRKRWRELLYYIIPGASLAIGLYFYFIHGGIQNPKFMSVDPWFTSKGLVDWLGFWGKAWGFMLPLALVMPLLFRKKISKETLGYVLGAWVLFLLANVILFQPISWDNSKLYVWCYFAFSGVLAIGVDLIWSKQRILATLIVLTLTVTGFFELVLLQRFERHTFMMVSAEDIKLAEEIKKGTAPLERFLTSKDHNHWVMMMAARPILLGYTAWVWNFGFQYEGIERDVSLMYQGGPQANDFLTRHKISYVVIGPSERYNLKPNEDYFRSHFPVAFSSPQTSVYDVRKLLLP